MKEQTIVTPDVKDEVVKRVLVTAKGFPALGEAGVKNLVKNCENFLSSGKLVWAFGDYMGITGAGKCGTKHTAFLAQLSANEDVECVKQLQSLIPEVIVKMADTSHKLVIESVALRTYFMPLLKIRKEVEEVSPEVKVEDFAGLEKIGERLDIE